MANKHRLSSYVRLINAVNYSVKGLMAVWKNEVAFRQEAVVTVIGIVAAMALDCTAVERVLLIGSLILIMIFEIINSGIETIIDYLESNQHPLAGQAKDIGSAAVFMAILLAVFTWLSVLWA